MITMMMICSLVFSFKLSPHSLSSHENKRRDLHSEVNIQYEDDNGMPDNYFPPRRIVTRRTTRRSAKEIEVPITRKHYSTTGKIKRTVKSNKTIDEDVKKEPQTIDYHFSEKDLKIQESILCKLKS